MARKTKAAAAPLDMLSVETISLPGYYRVQVDELWDGSLGIYLSKIPRAKKPKVSSVANDVAEGTTKSKRRQARASN
jgi:hypothetical protein